MANKEQVTGVLAKVQNDLKAPKSQFNKFGGYYYRSCEDILAAVKPLLAEHGLAIIVYDAVKQIGDRYYFKATAEISDDNNVFFSATGWAREQATKKGMDESQITGAASSYARKYALNGLLALDDQKDADAHGDVKQDRATPPKKQGNSDQKGSKSSGPPPTKTDLFYRFLQSAGKLKKQLNSLTGDDHLYYSELGGMGYEKSNQIKDLETQKRFINSLKGHINLIEARNASEGEDSDGQ